MPALLPVPFPRNFEVLAQQAEEIAGLAQIGVEVGKFAFLAGDEFVVEHQPEHGLVEPFGQRLQGFALAVLQQVLHGLGGEKGGLGTGVGGGGSGHTYGALNVIVDETQLLKGRLTFTIISKILVI